MTASLSGDEAQRLLTEIVPLARTAGDKIMTYYQGDFEVRSKADASPVTAADEAAETVIIEGLQRLTPDIPVVADFWAEWCGPCKALEPPLQEIAAEHSEQLKVVKVDIESNPTVTSNYKVLTIPTLIIFKNGQEVERLNGDQTREAMLEKIKPHLDQ